MSLQKSRSEQHLPAPQTGTSQGLPPTFRKPQNGRGLGLNLAPGPYWLQELGSGLALPSPQRKWEQ